MDYWICAQTKGAGEGRRGVCIITWFCNIMLPLVVLFLIGCASAANTTGPFLCPAGYVKTFVLQLEFYIF
jgi:hypothetical protein